MEPILLYIPVPLILVKFGVTPHVTDINFIYSFIQTELTTT